MIEAGKAVQNTYVGSYLQHQKDVATGAVSLKYQLRDQLGSVDVVLDAQGKVLERLAYAPFGGLRGADWSNAAAPMKESRRGFTDHEHLQESGLIHMNGRVYDPALGRFLSADIVYQDATNAQMFNRYAYAFNSPFSAIDPSGYATQPIFSASVYPGLDLFRTDNRVFNTGYAALDVLYTMNADIGNIFKLGGNIAWAGLNIAPITWAYASDRTIDQANGDIFALTVSGGGAYGAVAGKLLTLNSLRRVGSLEALVSDSSQLSIGAGRKNGQSLFNPTGAMDNCVNGVCAFLNTIRTGELHQASPRVAENGGRINVALNQISEQTGAYFGARKFQFSTLETARDRQFFVVFDGPDAQVSGHVAIGIVNKGNKTIFDPQTGETFKDISKWSRSGSFIAYPLIFKE